MVEVARLGDGQDRSEDLFLEDARLGVDVGDDGRLDEVAVARAAAPPATQAAFLLADLDVVEDRLARALVDDRPHVVGGIIGRADRERLDLGHQLFEELRRRRLPTTMAREQAEHFWPW